jgi:hypothetical protein
MRRVFGLVGVFVFVWVVCCCGVVGVAFALPAGRGYEMVSPVYKGGFGVDTDLESHGIKAVALDGESVAFISGGAFAGAPGGFSTFNYLARRGVSGWSTVSLIPPETIQPEGASVDATPSLGLVLRLGYPGSSFANLLHEEQSLLHSTDVPDTVAGWELDGVFQPLNGLKVEAIEVSASPDLCHLLLSAGGSSPLVAEAVGASEEVYQFDRGCGGGVRSLALVGVNNMGRLIDPACFTTAGVEEYSVFPSDLFNAVSVDGGEVFFTTCVGGHGVGPEVPHQLFVRVGGSRTLEVSRPLDTSKAFGGCVREVMLGDVVAGEVPCDGAAGRASADFAGASQDGSRVFFTTAAPLVSGDTDSGNDLYMARIGCPVGDPGCVVSGREVTSLVQVSHDPTSGQAADVRGVVRVAPDGTRVYFVAGGDLLSPAQRAGLEGEGRAVPRVGAANLYVYDSAHPGIVAFVAGLCSCDVSLWAHGKEGEVQTAGVDGRFLVFATYAQLLGSDTNVARDVYRYDAVTGRLVRVSGGEDGYDANGNRTVLGSEGEVLGADIAAGNYGGLLRLQYEMYNRAVSEDGSRIVFSSAEPLSAAASNGKVNVYEWHEAPGGGGEGSVSLVSSGSGPDPVLQVVISPSGNDIFFVTTDGLVPQDTDGAEDIYDARIGGGFPLAPAPVQPCSGDACQGPLTNPAPLLVPGSVSQAPGENVPAPVVVRTKPKIKHKRKPAKKHAKRKATSHGKGRR